MAGPGVRSISDRSGNGCRSAEYADGRALAKGAPGSEAHKDELERIEGETIVNVHNPSLLVFLPRKEINTGVALILAPGGGHKNLWIMHEGFNPAQALAQKGIAVFVLKNRLQSSGYTFDVEGLADMHRAIRVVRSRAAEWLSLIHI